MSSAPRNSGLLRPQSPEVYRRRRLTVLVLLLLVLAIVVGLVWWVVSLVRPAGGDTSQPGGNASASVTAPASPSASGGEESAGASASPDPSASASADPSASTGPSASPDPSGSAGASDDPSASPSDGASASGEASASPTATAADCRPGDLVISGATDRQAYAEGQDPVLELRVDNTGQEPCQANLGTTQQVFTVYSGSDRIFSTEDCQVEGQDAMIVISPDEQERSRFTWPRVRSAPECGEVTAAPRSGTYRLEVSLGELTAQPVTFTLQ